MYVIRYVALAALVVVLGGSVLRLAQMLDTARLASFDIVAAGCGAVIVTCLFAMKFIGPPPRAFTIRVGVAFLMTAVAVYEVVFRYSAPWTSWVGALLGLVLLAWYAVE